MDIRDVDFRKDLENHKRAKTYYQSIRRPWLERITFGLALLASVAVSLRGLGLFLPAGSQWLTISFWICLLMFIGLDSVFAKAHHPLPVTFGGFNPSRMFEKFSMQGRAWQLVIVLMLPVASLLIRGIIVTLHSTRP